MRDVSASVSALVVLFTAVAEVVATGIIALCMVLLNGSLLAPFPPLPSSISPYTVCYLFWNDFFSPQRSTYQPLVPSLIVLSFVTRHYSSTNCFALHITLYASRFWIADVCLASTPLSGNYTDEYVSHSKQRHYGA